MLTQIIRRQFLAYFKEKQHALISSSPVVPHDDPTLLFINAGMNQFKDVFLGKTRRDYTKATSSQKCIRVGGKHNDLENVGHTSRHLTFFEMLGNFSFGDYFKEQAIQYAWEVSTTVFGFDAERIWPTVFHEDDEAFEIWTHYVPAERITRFGEKDNFWMMGETGPCGPCSELLYDRGSEYGYATKPSEDPNGERFLEFWNLVFMQYNRDLSGQKLLLPNPSIDTGAGLERVVNLKLGANSVFETDVLRSIIAELESITKIPYKINSPNAPAFRVIADHLRCLSFAIADGIQPSNVDRGYVLRKVLRRAVRYGRQLGMDKPFLADVLPQLISVMGEDYPELGKAQNRIADILTAEEESFIRTLRRGGNILSQVVEKAQQNVNHIISGEEAFKLKDTYGFPFEEIALIAKDSNVSIDDVRYQELEEEARQRSRQKQKNTSQLVTENVFADFAQQHGETHFNGYHDLSTQAAVIGIIVGQEWVQRIEEGMEATILLNQTPFYAEMGGQVGDKGILKGENSSFLVTDCQSPYKGIIAHHGLVKQGSIQIGQSVLASVDETRRQKIANNHTATHLLHWALQKVLGEHIKQAGSVVDSQRLRFDFSHHKALTALEIQKIEELVNAKIRENQAVNWYELSYDDAQKRQDIKQFFGEKYGSLVRVIDIDYSKELCGGTHTTAVGNIGFLRIVKESSIAAGVRRIEAVTGYEAEQFVYEQEKLLAQLAQTLKVTPLQIQERLEKIVEENKELAQQLKNKRDEELLQLVQKLLEQQKQIGSLKYVVLETALSVEDLRQCVDYIAEKMGSGIVVLATVLPEKCQLMAKVSQDWVDKGFSANDLIKISLPIIDGSGGGKPQTAQGGGKSPHMLNEALNKITDDIQQKFNAFNGLI